MLDPEAISMMPPELENPISSDDAIQDLMQRTSLEEENEDVSQVFAPKGSLV